jgi:acetyltransferase ESCO-like protein
MTAVRCPECRLSYSDTSPDDRRLHRTLHDQAVPGVLGPIRKIDRVIWSEGVRWITVVQHRVATHHEKVRAERVAQWAREDTPFDFAAYHASDLVVTGKLTFSSCMRLTALSDFLWPSVETSRED